MWSVTSSPLIASLDLRHVKPELLNILINKDAIAVNQQYAGNAGDLLEEQGGQTSACQWGRCYTFGKGEVWYKPLPGGEAAVALLNAQNTSTGVPMRLNVSFASLAALGSDVDKCTVYDIWEGNSTEIQKEIVVEAVQPQSVKFFRISECSQSRMMSV